MIFKNRYVPQKLRIILALFYELFYHTTVQHERLLYHQISHPNHTTNLLDSCVRVSGAVFIFCDCCIAKCFPRASHDQAAGGRRTSAYYEEDENRSKSLQRLRTSLWEPFMKLSDIDRVLFANGVWFEQKKSILDTRYWINMILSLTQINKTSIIHGSTFSFAKLANPIF